MLLSLLLSAMIIVHKSRTSCPSYFDPWYDGVCGNVLSQYYTNYTYALQRCTDLGGYLPSVHSDKENVLLYETAVSKILHEDPFDHSMWMGLQCHGNHTYSWMDGTPYDYDRPMAVISGNCNKSTFYATDYALQCCDGIGWVGVDPFGNAVVEVVVCTAASSLDTPCNDFDETMSGSSKCMKLYTNAMTWTDAQETCKNNGADLYSIHSDTENSFVRRIAIANGLIEGVHIGLMNMNSTAPNWTWVDESPLNYTNYANAFNDPTLGDCTAMQIVKFPGQWMNIPCQQQKLPFVCSRPEVIHGNR